MAVNNEKREKFGIPAVGANSLLTVFAVLCLTIFALLAVSTVQADMRLSDASAQAVRDYYAADYTAQEIFSHLRSGEDPAGLPLDEVRENGDETYYAFTVKISDTQELQVEIAERQGSYQVLSWQAASSQPWENDEHIKVWDGSMP